MSIFAPDEDREQRWGATLERSQPGTQCFRMGRYLMVRPFFLITQSPLRQYFIYHN